MPPLMMACGATPAISRPSKLIEPAVGTSVPDSMLKIVLLPEPFGPIRPRISPCSTLKRHVVDRGEAAKPLHQTVDDKHRDYSCRCPAYCGLNVKPLGSGSTASRCAWLFGHTT